MTLRLRSFSLDERLHGPYDLRIAANLEGCSDPDVLLGAHVELGIHRGVARRVLYGLVLAVERDGNDRDPGLVRIEVGPALALFGRQPRSRIFQDCSVVDIVRTVLEQPLLAYGSALDVSRLVSRYSPRECCVQYRETDLAFVLRILAEAGITLLLHHGDGSETVVLIDSNDALPPGGWEPLDRDEKAKIPWLPTVAERTLDQHSESIRLEVLLTDVISVELHAKSDATILRAGSVFELEDPPTDAHDETWVVTFVRHAGLAPVADAEADFNCEVRCRPWRLPLQLARPPRPRVTGTQRAIVVGLGGEPAVPDARGRVHVRMRWDEDEQGAGHSTCWLPVGPSVAGSTLRTGTDVLVSFIDGDPDRPVCTGVVFISSPIANSMGSAVHWA